MPKLAVEVACSARERTALEFAERFATEHTRIDEAFMAEMRKIFSDPEIVELGLVTGAFLMLGRLHLAFGVPTAGPDIYNVLRGQR